MINFAKILELSVAIYDLAVPQNVFRSVYLFITMYTLVNVIALSDVTKLFFLSENSSANLSVNALLVLAKFDHDFFDDWLVNFKYVAMESTLLVDSQDPMPSTNAKDFFCFQMLPGHL